MLFLYPAQMGPYNNFKTKAKGKKHQPLSYKLVGLN